MKKYILFLVFGLSLGFTACTKCDDDSTGPEPTRTELLTSHNWRPISRMTSTNGSSSTSNTFQSCDADDFIQFQTSGAFKYDDGYSLCEPTFVKAFTGTWALNINESIITIDKNSGSLLEAEILELTTEKLVLKIIRTEQNDTYTSVETYLPL